MKTNIFIIDDDRIFRLMTLKMIEKVNLPNTVIEECENGEIGLEKLKNIDKNNKVIIFLDINMPVLNGWQFLDKFKKNNYFNIQKIVLYMASSSTDKDDFDRAKQYSIITEYLIKPIEFKKIESTLLFV